MEDILKESIKMSEQIVKKRRKAMELFPKLIEIEEQLTVDLKALLVAEEAKDEANSFKLKMKVVEKILKLEQLQKEAGTKGQSASMSIISPYLNM